MDAIEKAIRNAFDKGNADDCAFREKVYRSAFAALDRALQANPGVTVETAIKRRKAMQAKIAEIESEFLPAVGAPPEQAGAEDAAPAIDPPATSAASAAPPVDGPPGPASAAPRVEPAVDGPPGAAVHPYVPSAAPAVRLERDVAEAPTPDARPAAISPDRDERRARRRRSPVAALLGLIVLAAAGYGLWWAAQNGLLRMPGRVNAPGSSAGGTVSLPQSGAASDEREWIVVFAPNDPTLVDAPADAEAAVMEDDSGSFLRIRSGASGAAVSFEVGQGVLQQLAGRHAVFDIVARAEDGKNTEIAVDCNFGELGDCGRRRYAVGHEKNEYLFDVRFPDKQAGAAGTIAIDSDFERQGRSVDIYEIRASVAE